jgi:hypothetical protein
MPTLPRTFVPKEARSQTLIFSSTPPVSSNPLPATLEENSVCNQMRTHQHPTQSSKVLHCLAVSCVEERQASLAAVQAPPHPTPSHTYSDKLTMTACFMARCGSCLHGFVVCGFDDLEHGGGLPQGNAAVVHSSDRVAKRVLRLCQCMNQHTRPQHLTPKASARLAVCRKQYVSLYSMLEECLPCMHICSWESPHKKQVVGISHIKCILTYKRMNARADILSMCLHDMCRLHWRRCTHAHEPWSQASHFTQTHHQLW